MRFSSIFPTTTSTFCKGKIIKGSKTTTMVFTSAPIYEDPPNSWNQLEDAEVRSIPGGGSVMSDANLLHQQMLHQATAAGGGGGGGLSRPSSMTERAKQAKLPSPEEALKCPRCDSANTKFCYYNNYSLSQPRHFCKTCRRYWTRGGALRNVPVGGGYRRNKRSKSSASSSLNAVVAAAGASAKQSHISSVVSTRATSNAMVPGSVLPSPAFSFLTPWQHLHDNTSINEAAPGFTGFQREYSTSGLGSALQQWKIQQTQQFPFLGVMASSTSPATTAETEMYTFEAEGRQLRQMAAVKMEDTSPDTPELPWQFFAAPKNEQQLWGVNDGSVGGGGSHGGWVLSDSGFNSSTAGTLL